MYCLLLIDDTNLTDFKFRRIIMNKRSYAICFCLKRRRAEGEEER